MWLPTVDNRSLEIFYDYLLQRVQFPYYGVFAQDNEQRQQEYYPVVVKALIDPDESEELEKYGILAFVIWNDQEVKMPVAEIVINQGDPNYDVVEDYCTWYWDHK